MFEPEVNLLVDVADFEILEIERVLRSINERHQGQTRNLEAFRLEVIERFADIGFKINFKVYDSNIPNMFLFDIDIISRTENKEFDLDRQVWEATKDILELGTEGVIRTSKFRTDQKPIKEDPVVEARVLEEEE